MKNIYNWLWMVGLLASACTSMQTTVKDGNPSDSLATASTKELYGKLIVQAKKGVMIGHQDDLAYGHGWYGEEGRSDVKDISGHYPPVLGLELGDVELGRVRNLDSVYFDAMRRYVQQTNARGGVSTFSWHGNNVVTGGNAWDCDLDSVVRAILPGGVHHAAYLARLDRVAAFFSSLRDEQGNLIPVVFRPYHEHTGSWFWWGAKQCTPEEYKSLWRMTVDYFRHEKDIHHILYCYSPAETMDERQYMERYPGDDVVDMVAFDAYVPDQGTAADLAVYKATMQRNLDILATVATATGKVATIGETGYEGIKDSRYFTEIVYPLLQGRKLAWVLFWRNAYEADKGHHYYVPFKGHPAAADFVEFSQKEGVLLNTP